MHSISILAVPPCLKDRFNDSTIQRFNLGPFAPNPKDAKIKPMNVMVGVD